MRFEDGAIDTISKSRDRFSKIDQLKEDYVRRLQHVAAFPAKIKLLYPFGTTGIKNNPSIPRDVKISDDILERSKHLSSGKTTMYSSELIDSARYIIELPPTIKL